MAFTREQPIKMYIIDIFSSMLVITTIHQFYFLMNTKRKC